jgi:hypothetical protein
MKHNKKRNTAFLYEALVRELTKASLRSDESIKSRISFIFKEHFGSKSVLSRELGLYKAIVDTNGVDKETAERILSEVKRVYHSLSSEEIYDEQSEVIEKINKDLSRNVFNNFVPNYKSLASIYQMFNNKTPINRKIMLEKKMIDKMASSSRLHEPLKPVDSLTYKVFVNKFNEKYGDSLNENQKALLSRYVVLSPETSAEFKIYISEEIERLKRVVSNIQNKKEIILDESLSEKNKQVMVVLEGFAGQTINDDMVKRILKIQSLASEA